MLKNMFRMKNIVITALSICAVSAAQAAPLTSFEEMVKKTVSSNPEVQARYHRLMETGFEREVANGGFFPRADIVGRYRKQEDKDGNYTRQSSTGFANPRFNAELVISQMLFDGFATRSEVRRLDHIKKQAYYDLQNSMQETSLEFTTAYLDILRYRELADMAKENYVIHRQLYSKIKERVSAGVARKVDQDQAAGRLALAEANLLVETTNLHDVTARMQRVYGDLPPDTLAAPTFHNNGVEPTVTDALQVAYVSNPDLLAKIEGIEASHDEIKGRKSAFLPRFDLQARKNIDHSSNGRLNDSTADVLELSMNYNIFNGFSDQNSIKQTAERLNGTKDLRDKACIDTRQTVVIAYNDIKQLKEQLNYRLAHKSSIESAKVAYDKQFDIGQRTLLDLLDTQNEYFQAKRALTNTEYDLQTAFARTYAGQGKLLEKIGVARADVPEIQRDEYLDAETVCQAAAPTMMQVDKDALVLDAKPLPVATMPVAPKPAAIQPKRAVAPCSVGKVTSTVKDWATAASRKNINDYLYFYANDFTPAAATRADWETAKRKDMRKKGKTNFSISDINATCDGDVGHADFKLKSRTTTYKLKKVADTSCEVCNMKRIPHRGPAKTVAKSLDFKRVNGLWKIVDEKPL